MTILEFLCELNLCIAIGGIFYDKNKCYMASRRKRNKPTNKIKQDICCDDDNDPGLNLDQNAMGCKRLSLSSNPRSQQVNMDSPFFK